MTNQDHIWHILDDVLLLLAGQHYPTPERTYKLDGGWSLALADLKWCFADLRAKLALVEAERDAAQAGEARAVEALDVFARAYRVSMLPFAPGIDEADGAHHGWPSVAELDAAFKQANAALTDSSALDWLAQQRREAAVEALEKLAADLGKDQWESALHDVDSLRGILRTRAAALRAGEVGNE